MKKYYFGFGLLLITTLVLFGYVAMQGASSKKDQDTYKAATNAADKLNSYVSKHQKIPSNLIEAGMTNTPPTISYHKVSESEYRFCATYKNSSLRSIDPTTILTGSAITGSDSASAGNYYSGSYSPSSLFIDSTHNKGENCQTVNPILYNYNDFLNNNNVKNYDFGTLQ